MNKTDYLRKKGQLPKEDYGYAIYLEANEHGVEIHKLLIWEIGKDRESKSSSLVDGKWIDEKRTVNSYEFNDGYPSRVSIDKETGVGHVDTYIKGHFITSYICLKEEDVPRLKMEILKAIHEILKPKPPGYYAGPVYC